MESNLGGYLGSSLDKVDNKEKNLLLKILVWERLTNLLNQILNYVKDRSNRHKDVRKSTTLTPTEMKDFPILDNFLYLEIRKQHSGT